MCITIKESIEIFVKGIIVDNKAEATVKAYKTDMQIFYNFIKTTLNNRVRYVNDLRYVHLEMYKEFLIEKYDIKTASRKYNCLRTYFKTLYRFNYINDDLIRIIKSDTFGNKKRDKISEISYISDETLKTILNRVKSNTSKNKYRDIAIFEILLMGLRRSELLELRWSDIDFFECTMFIRRSKTSNCNTVELSKTAFEALKKYYRIDMSSTRRNEYVFCSGSGKLSLTAFKSIVSKYTAGLTTVTLQDITPHSFRHTFITKMIKEGIAHEVIQKYVGVTLETLQTYTHLNHKDTSSVAHILDSISCAV